MGTATTRGPIIVTTEGPETETSPGPITSLGSAEITTGPTGPPSGMSHHIHTGTLLCSLLVCVSVVFRLSTLVTNIATISHHPNRTIFHICIIRRNNQMPLIVMINPAVKLKITENRPIVLLGSGLQMGHPNRAVPSIIHFARYAEKVKLAHLLPPSPVLLLYLSLGIFLFLTVLGFFD